MSKMETADELQVDGTAKLQNVLSSSTSGVDSQGAKVACIMIETAKTNHEKAKRKLEAVREKQRQISKKNQKQLERALPARASAPSSKKRNTD